MVQAYDGTELTCHLKGAGEPLLVVPGGAMRASAYLGDLGGLSAHRRLAVLDLRGTGESAVPADPESYRCDRQVDDVEALRAHLGLEQVDLLAHSAGGNLALLYAARHPERIRRLALITPNAWALEMQATVAERLAAARLRSGEPWFEAAYTAFEAALSGQEPKDSFAPFFYGRWDAAAEAHAATDLEQVNREAAARFGGPGAYDPSATRAVLRSLEAPVLVLAGELDGAPRPDRAVGLAALFPAGECVVQPGGGHFPWLDDPQWYVRTVARFLSL
ncbi:alpha/beta fold hydrolase [Streptomyces sp. NPDC002187]|uniref:alpha/beta fold hydrolase n=1 Tax=Streptomyces sp. NPDC002187 TaxID=3364637 RepID=UPI0036BAC164